MSFLSPRLLDCASGNAHMLALTQAHEVFAWGCSDSGQTGQNSLFHWRFPKRVELWIDFVLCASPVGRFTVLSSRRCPIDRIPQRFSSGDVGVVVS